MIDNAPRDQARARRVIALKKAYARTGDPRKRKREKRIMRQLHRAQMRRMNMGLQSVSQVMRAHEASLRKFVASITDAFAKIRQTPPR